MKNEINVYVHTLHGLYNALYEYYDDFFKVECKAKGAFNSLMKNMGRLAQMTASLVDWMWFHAGFKTKT